jgi:hypothetical protein
LKGVSLDCGKKFGSVIVGVVIVAIVAMKNHGGMTTSGQGVGVGIGEAIGDGI